MEIIFTEEFYNEYSGINIVSNIYSENMNGKFTSIQEKYCDNDFYNNEEDHYDDYWD